MARADSHAARYFARHCWRAAYPYRVIVRASMSGASPSCGIGHALSATADLSSQRGHVTWARTRRRLWTIPGQPVTGTTASGRASTAAHGSTTHRRRRWVLGPVMSARRAALSFGSIALFRRRPVRSRGLARMPRHGCRALADQRLACRGETPISARSRCAYHAYGRPSPKVGRRHIISKGILPATG